MKVLHLDLYYNLPDDFAGTFEDAILQYLSYRKNKGHLPNQIGFSAADDLTADNMWEKFLIALDTTDYKCVMACSLTELDPITNNWINLLDPIE